MILYNSNHADSNGRDKDKEAYSNSNCDYTTINVHNNKRLYVLSIQKQLQWRLQLYKASNNNIYIKNIGHDNDRQQRQ